ncbi:MAG: transglycosylase SLT domain-containing protein [Candidatus Saccharibacteria bacterium]|nr:transglycosylase SLT domain-containing protein [Rhodoferax sp.]
MKSSGQAGPCAPANNSGLRRGLALAGLVLLTLLTACQTLPQMAAVLPAEVLGMTAQAVVLHDVGPPFSVDLTNSVRPIPTSGDAILPMPLPMDLWWRLRLGFGIVAPASVAGDGVLAQRVATHVQWYQQNPAHMQRTFARGQAYLFDIVEELEHEGMPLELALLPAVESAYQTAVCSRAAACGLWQFMAPTARRFDLKQHLFVDERRHVRAATRAALRYLRALHTRFGDWPLALAAYNCGEGCIEKAQRKAREKGLPSNFENLELARETEQYVPRLLALAQIVANPAGYGMSLPELGNTPYFVAVPITRDMDVALAARLAGMPVADFMALNQQHQKPLLVAASNPEVFVPVAQAPRFVEALARHAGVWASWAAVRIDKASSVDAIALAHHADATQIRAVNGIAPKRLVQAGSTLLLPRPIGSLTHDITMQTAEAATLTTLAMPAPRQVKSRRTAVPRVNATITQKKRIKA